MSRNAIIDGGVVLCPCGSARFMGSGRNMSWKNKDLELRFMSNHPPAFDQIFCLGCGEQVWVPDVVTVGGGEVN